MLETLAEPKQEEKQEVKEVKKEDVPIIKKKIDTTYESSTVDKYQDKVNDAYKFKLPITFFQRPAKKIAEDLMGLYFNEPKIAMNIITRLLKSNKLTLFQQRNCELAKIKLKKLIRHEK